MQKHAAPNSWAPPSDGSDGCVDERVNTVTTEFWRRFDSVYFLMWPGWRDQLESNRWHWGKRWGQRLPVVFVQPELPPGERSRLELETRLENVHILSIEAATTNLSDLLAVGLRQAGQLASHMRHHGHGAPLLWFYNPWLTAAYLLSPAVARIYHATENYFDFASIDTNMLDLIRGSAAASNMVICCSSGVAQGFQSHAACREPIVIPNGCEYDRYRHPHSPIGDWPRQIADWVAEDRRLAVFAGNINLRLDFRLMLDTARLMPDLGFVYVGPVDTPHLSAEQQLDWAALLALPNVRVLGRMQPQDLPALYRRCDVGIIPYREDMPMLVDNGFPLKAFEMAAAGLPVVSSLMRPLLDVPEVVVVASGAQAFRAALGRNSRRTRSAQAAAAADRVCRAYDYDMLFEQMLAAFEARFEQRQPPTGGLDALQHCMGFKRYLDMLARFDEPVSPSSSMPFFVRCWSRVPLPVKRAVPETVRQRMRDWLT